MHAIHVTILLFAALASYHAASADQPNDKSIGVAFAFWGMTRSLNRNLDSIKKHIFDPINNMPSVRSYIFIHTYQLKGLYTNPRAGEREVRLNNTEYLSLKADFIQVEDQDLVSWRIQLDRYHLRPDAWNTPNHSSTNFMILAMWSKLQLTRMIKESEISFKYVIFIRPDTTFNSPLNVTELKQLDDTDAICCPKNGRWGGGKLGSFNDKLALTSGSTYERYGSIFPHLLNYSKLRSLHSESIYSDYLGDQGIKLCSTDVDPIKVRAINQS